MAWAADEKYSQAMHVRMVGMVSVAIIFRMACWSW